MQDYVNRSTGVVAYGTNMPPELMQNHPYGRLPYGQQPMSIYTQNQPLPPGEHPAYSPLRQRCDTVLGLWFKSFVFPQEVQD